MLFITFNNQSMSNSKTKNNFLLLQKCTFFQWKEFSFYQHEKKNENKKSKRTDENSLTNREISGIHILT